MKKTYETYNNRLALVMFKKGFQILLFHPDEDKGERLTTAAEIAECDGHLLGICLSR